MPRARRTAEEQKGLFFIPQNAEFFCICHMRFWANESTFKSHMKQSSTKIKAGAKAVQCANCYRWFSNKGMRNAHYGRVNNRHTLPDSMDFVIVGVPNGEGGLKMESRGVLCLNTEETDLDELEPQNAPLED